MLSAFKLENYNPLECRGKSQDSEWSKELDLSPSVVKRVGSNPTPDKVSKDTNTPFL